MMKGWHSEWTVRPASFDDIDLAVDMFNARSRAFYGENQSTADEMLGWWRSPRFDLERDARVVLDGGGRMIGWAHVGNPGEPYVSIGCGVIVHPDVAGNEALWDRLYAWALEHARRLVPLAPAGARVAASEGAMDIDEARRTAAERAGFERVRVENHMRIDLDDEIPPPAWPDGISMRPAAIDRDLPEMAAASREAFRDHWGFVDEPLEQVLEGWRSWVASLGDALIRPCGSWRMKGRRSPGSACSVPGLRTIRRGRTSSRSPFVRRIGSAGSRWPSFATGSGSSVDAATMRSSWTWTRRT